MQRAIKPKAPPQRASQVAKACLLCEQSAIAGRCGEVKIKWWGLRKGVSFVHQAAQGNKERGVESARPARVV